MNFKWSSIVTFANILSFVLAYPNAPGTCDLELMSTIGHGPSKSTCKDCYNVQITQSAEYEPFTISVTSRQEYQGFIVQVKNSNNQTVGEFINFDEDVYYPVLCEEVDEEKHANDWAGSIGHVDAKLKSWPINLSWTSARKDVYDSTSNVFRIQGMIVMDYDNYDILPEYSFTIKKRRPIEHPVIPSVIVNTTTTTVITTATATKNIALPETTLIPPENPRQEQSVQNDPESTVLFLRVFCFVLAVYFIMAIVRRKWYQRRMPAADPEAFLKEG